MLSEVINDGCEISGLEALQALEEQIAETYTEEKFKENLEKTNIDISILGKIVKNESKSKKNAAENKQQKVENSTTTKPLLNDSTVSNLRKLRVQEEQMELKQGMVKQFDFKNDDLLLNALSEIISEQSCAKNVFVLTEIYKRLQLHESQ